MRTNALSALSLGHVLALACSTATEPGAPPPAVAKEPEPFPVGMFSAPQRSVDFAQWDEGQMLTPDEIKAALWRTVDRERAIIDELRRSARDREQEQMPLRRLSDDVPRIMATAEPPRVRRRSKRAQRRHSQGGAYSPIPRR